MEILRQIDILCLLISHMVLGLVGYWLGCQSACDHYEEIKEPAEDELWTSPSENLTSPEVHSPAYLIELAKYELFVYEALSDLAKNQTKLFQQTLLVKIEEYLHVFTEERRFIQVKLNITNIENEALTVSQNPLLCLNMIWRFSNELTQIAELIRKQLYNSRVTEGKGKDFIKDLNAIAKWPNQWATENALAAFLRIQMVYNLNVTELATGRIFGVEAAPHLDVSLMFALGTFAREKQMYNLAVPWLDLTWDTLNNAQNDRPTQHIYSKVNIVDVEIQLFGAIIDHDKAHPGTEPEYWQYYLYRDKLLYENQSFVEKRYPMRGLNWTHFRRFDLNYNDLNYWSLCSGDSHQTEKERAQLNCWYDRTSDPALTIFPVKKELLSQTPYILRMYDVIGESAINDIIEPVKHQFERSRVTEFFTSTAPDASTLEPVIDYRTSVDTFLTHELPKLSKLMEWTVGLNVISYPGSSEVYFVTSYSFGGHYDCHLDSFQDERSAGFQGGNRIATMMLYLDDTQLGGLTAFPQAGVAVKPVKGSAIFWYNLKRSGAIDFDTHHCACPVVLGHKTISTKWIGGRNQFQRRPCGVNKDE